MSCNFLELVSKVVDPREVCFRAFSESSCIPGMARLSELASRVATRHENDTAAFASLRVLPGVGSAFEIDGTHARATLGDPPALGAWHRDAECERGKSWWWLVLVVVVLVVCVWLGRRKCNPTCADEGTVR